MSFGRYDAPQESVTIKEVTCYGNLGQGDGDFFVLGEYPDDHPRLPGRAVEFLWDNATFAFWPQAVDGMLVVAREEGWELAELVAC
jgi:hypothetical protein